MLSNGEALDLGPNYFERMGKRGADHPRNHSSHKVVDAYCFGLLVESVVKSCESALFVAGRQSSLEKASKSLMLINLHSIF